MICSNEDKQPGGDRTRNKGGRTGRLAWSSGPLGSTGALLLTVTLSKSLWPWLQLCKVRSLDCSSAQRHHHQSKNRNILVLFLHKQTKDNSFASVPWNCFIGHKTDPAGSRSQQVGVHKTASCRKRPKPNPPASGRRTQSFLDQVRWLQTLRLCTRLHRQLCKEIITSSRPWAPAPPALGAGLLPVPVCAQVHEWAAAQGPQGRGNGALGVFPSDPELETPHQQL